MFSPFLHLKENPFGETPNVNYFFKSKVHLKSLSALYSAVKAGKGFSLASGEVGTGKTLLCRLFLKVLEDESCQTAAIFQPILEDRDMLIQIRQEFAIPAPSGTLSFKEELDLITEFVFKCAERKQRCVILIDEAHKLSFEALETIRLLTNLETTREKLIQVVLFAQPELETKLAAHHMRQIRQRLTTVTHLAPLELDEVREYILHRVEKAGGGNFLRFEPGAIKLIYKKSRGIPRLINFYSELGLLAAENHQQRLITRPLLLESCSEVEGPTRAFTKLFNMDLW